MSQYIAELTRKEVYQYCMTSMFKSEMVNREYLCTKTASLKLEEYESFYLKMKNIYIYFFFKQKFYYEEREVRLGQKNNKINSKKKEKLTTTSSTIN